MTLFRGVIPPICTPLDEYGDVDSAGLERLVASMLSAGVHGIFALGSTGEGIYLDDAARKRVLDVVVGAVAGAVPVLAGAVDATTDRVVDQVRWMRKFRLDAIVVTAPFYAVVSPAETVAHFETVAASSPVPVVAYDIPVNVGRKLPRDVSIDLISRRVVVGLKDSSGDLAEFAAVLQAVRSIVDVSVLTGSDVGALESLRAGAHGVVPGIANICAGHFVSLWEAFAAGDDDTAERTQAKVSALTEIYGIGVARGLGLHASQLGALKSVLVHDGVIGSARVSRPLSSYPASGAEEAARIAMAARG